MIPETKTRIEQIGRGEVPDGYKKTKAGILPADWDVYMLGNCLSRVEKPVEVRPNELYTQIGIRSHGKGLFYKEPVTGAALGNKSVFWIEPDCFILNIVFAWEQAIGKTTQSEVGMIGSHRFPMYRPINDAIDVDYLISYFLTKRGSDILEAASPGGAGRNKTLGQDSFLKSKIVLPPIEEQQKIAEILTTQDKVIGLKEKRLAEKQRQKKYLMQQLLTGKKRLPGFREQWKKAKLGDVCVVNPPKKDYYPDVVAFLGMADISENGSIITEHKKKYESVKTGFTPFERGDILIAKITPCFENGKGVLTDKCSFAYGFGSTEFHVLRCKTANSKFLYHHTRTDSFRKRLEAEMIGSAGQKRVQANSIINYAILLPPPIEQAAIAEVLSTADRELDLLRQGIEQEKQKKKALMQLLLTGIVRVNV